MSSFYFLTSENFRYQTLDSYLANLSGDQWDFLLNVYSWDVTDMRNLKISTFWALNTSSYSSNCSATGSLNITVPARTCSGCSQKFVPLSCVPAPEVRCSSPNYSYANGSCLSSCPTPLAIDNQGSVLYCNYPCDPGEFLYWTGSCSSSCDFPLVQSLVAGDLYCVHPCGSSYLYWNGTCSTSCPSTMVPLFQNGKYFCNLPVPSFKFWQAAGDSKQFYLEFNQKMNATLAEIQNAISIRMSKSSSGDYNYQVSQASEQSYKIFFNPGTTIPAQKLNLTFISDVFNYVGNGLLNKSSEVDIASMYSSSTLKTIEQITTTTKTALVGVGSSSIPLVVLGGNPIFLWVLLNIIQNYYYLLFINVEYPLNINEMFSLFKVATLDFLPNIFNKVVMIDLEKEYIGSPEKFQDQEIDGFFLATGGESLTIMVAYALFSFAMYLILKFLRSAPFGLMPISRMNVKNFLPNIMKIWEALYININIAIFLQLRNMKFDDGLHAFSSVLGVLSLFGSLGILYYFFREGRKNVKKSKTFEFWTKTPVYRCAHPMCLMHPFIDFLQKFLFTLFLVLLYEYEIAVIAILFSLRILYVGFLAYFRPFLDSFSNVSNIVNEALYAIAILLVGVLFKLNQDLESSEEQKLLVGYMVIGLCMSTLGFTIFLMISCGIMGFKEFKAKMKILYQVYKGKKRDKVITGDKNQRIKKIKGIEFQDSDSKKSKKSVQFM